MHDAPRLAAGGGGAAVAGAGEDGGGAAHGGHGEARVVAEADGPVGVHVGELDLDGVEGPLGAARDEALQREGKEPALVLHLGGLRRHRAPFGTRSSEQSGRFRKGMCLLHLNNREAHCAFQSVPPSLARSRAPSTRGHPGLDQLAKTASPILRRRARGQLGGEAWEATARGGGRGGGGE